VLQIPTNLNFSGFLHPCFSPQKTNPQKHHIFLLTANFSDFSTHYRFPSIMPDFLPTKSTFVPPTTTQVSSNAIQLIRHWSFGYNILANLILIVAILVLFRFYWLERKKKVQLSRQFKIHLIMWTVCMCCTFMFLAASNMFYFLSACWSESKCFLRKCENFGIFPKFVNFLKIVSFDKFWDFFQVCRIFPKL
jgi:hypothetical protein